MREAGSAFLADTEDVGFSIERTSGHVVSSGREVGEAEVAVFIALCHSALLPDFAAFPQSSGCQAKREMFDRLARCVRDAAVDGALRDELYNQRRGVGANLEPCMKVVARQSVARL